MDNIGDRDTKLDVARTIAILMVLLIHTVEDLEYSIILNNNLHISNIKWFIETLLFIIGRIGVPIFCMLSGALMGKRKIDNLKEHYKYRVFSMMRVTIIWMIIYRILFYFLYDKNQELLNIKNIIKELVLFNPSTANHLWFMPMIIGIYIMMPFINKFIQNLNNSELYIFICLNIVFFFFIPTINLILKTTGIININDSIFTSIDYNFLGGPYLNYYIVGYMITNRNMFSNVSRLKLKTISIIVMLIAVLSQFNIYDNNVKINANFFWYDSVYIYVISICCFLLIIKKSYEFPNGLSKIFLNISKFSFGIYLIHRIFMNPIVEYLNLLSVRMGIKMIIAFSFTFILSYISIKIISLNKAISRLFINYKTN